MRFRETSPAALFTEDDQYVVRYLLDQAEAEERARFEERLSGEPFLFEAVSALEDDLIMRYVSGALEQHLVSRFEEVYLSSPARRARVDLARTTREAVRAVPLSQKDERPSVPFLQRRRALTFAAVAAAVVLIALLVPRWKNDLTGGVHPSTKPPQVSFLLEPGRVRSARGTRIVVSPAIQQVQFRLVLPGSNAGKNYRVVLGTPERPESWSGRASLQGGVAIATVPAASLTAGDYTLRLQSGNAKGGNWEDLEVYYFRVAR